MRVEHNGKVYEGFSADALRAAGVPDSIISSASLAGQLAAVLESRRLAYAAESDPLYMEWQYDQTAEAEQAWRDKVAEIKARYPLPAEA